MEGVLVWKRDLDFLESESIPGSQADEIRFNCPACSDAKFHLGYNTGKGIFHCVRCGFRGRDTHYKRRDFFTDVVTSREFSGSMPSGVFTIMGGRGRTEADAIAYLIGRGVTTKDIAQYNIHYGFCDKLVRRVVFPFIQRGKLVYYIARAIDDRKDKVINAAGSKRVFNLERAASFSKEVVVVEGVFDAIHTGVCAIAVLGKTITKLQCKDMQSYGITDVNLMFDFGVSYNHVVGVASNIKKFFRNVWIINLPFGDPADWKLRKKGVYGYKDILGRTAYSFAQMLDSNVIRRERY